MLKRKKIAIFTAICTVLLALALIPVFTGIGSVHAAGVIATVTKDGKTETYWNFKSLVNDVDDYSKKTVTIEMLADWNAAGNDMFDRRLYIPSGSHVTLNMHGHVFSRNNSWDKGDECFNGEMIKIDDDATLTINGGSLPVEKSVRHGQVPVHRSTSTDTTATGREVFYGGLLCGGASTNGAGGIHMDPGSTVIMNDVTLAGCRSHFSAVWSNVGNGGGIRFDGSDQKVRMNNSRITGCQAHKDGGGIYCDYFVKPYCTHTIELINSSIDHNYANNGGGGIYLNSDNTTVAGSKGSGISYNQCQKYGGGIYEDYEDTSITGFTMEGNKAKNGGAIYTNGENVGVSNIKASKNTAERGGGFYVWNDKTTLSNCELTENRATASGGGVYVASDVDEGFHVNGKAVVKDNTADVGFGKNFYISDNAPEDTRVNFNLTSGSDVRMSYYDTKNKDTIMVTEGKTADTIKNPDCTRFLTSENSGYYFDFLTPASQRKIILKKGKAPEKPKPTKISAADAAPVKVGKVGAGGGAGSDFDLIRGYFTHQKTDSATGDENRNARFYYSDALFYGGDHPDFPQNTYNPHLATTSLSMAFSAMYLQTEAEDVDGNTYYNKHAAGRQFLADIGCDEQKIYVNDSNVSKPETDSIGVIIGSKKLKKADGTETGDILIPIAVRGGGYEKEWASNVTLGTAAQTAPGKEAKGFANAANQVTAEVNKYLDRYNLRDDYEQGRVKFWIAGYSRAGATSNLTGKRLLDQIDKDCKGKRSQVFGYTFEAPKGGTDAAEKEGITYNSIHNIVNTADVVPLVAPEMMGFKRYGVDHYVPGDAAGNIVTTSKTVARGGAVGVNSKTPVTVKRDNTAMRTKGAKENDSECKAYNSKRNEMLKQLAMLDHEIVFDDYFHPMYMSFPTPKIKEAGTYDGTRVEDFLADVMTFFMEGMNYTILDHYSQAVCSRDRWVEPWGMNGKYYSTIEDALRDAMCLVFGMPSDDMGSFTNRAMTIMGRIPDLSITGKSMFDIWDQVIGDWHEQSPASKDKWTTFLWDKLEETGALDFLSSTEKASLKNDWPTILGFLLHFTDGDYNYKPGQQDRSWAAGSSEKMMYLATFATYSSYILSNHYPEVNLAWARTYDDWYSGETSEYTVTAPGSVDVPTAFTVENGERKKLEKTGVGYVNVLNGDQKICLDNESIGGEAIYYDLYELNSTGGAGKKLVSNSIYRGGIDLSSGADGAKSYRITAYDMSRGVVSGKVTYDIKVKTNRHKIIIVTKDINGEEKKIEALYEEGQEITIQAGEPADQYFSEWTVTLLDAKGGKVPGTSDSATASSVMGSQNVKNPVQTFTVPQVDSYFQDGYGLKVNAYYRGRIYSIDNASPAQPDAGALLPSTAEVNLNLSGTLRKYTYPISWSYSYEKDGKTITVPATGTAYDDTVYTAKITMPQDRENGIMFAPSDQLNPQNVDCRTGTVKSFTRNDDDGSASLEIEMPATQDTGENPRPDRMETVIGVNALDLNTGEYEESARVEYPVAGDITTAVLTAPEVQDEVFSQWDLKDTGITLAEGYKLTDKTIKVNLPENRPAVLELDAQFIPVISQIDVHLSKPAGGEPMQTEAKERTGDEPATLQVKISNDYEVHPDFVNVEWTPEPAARGGQKKADYLKSYTATVTLAPKDDDGQYIRVRKVGSKRYQDIEAVYHFSDSLKVTVNGKPAVWDAKNSSVSYTFPMTKYKLVYIDGFSDLTNIKRENGYEEFLRNLLPKTLNVHTYNGLMMYADVDWTMAKEAQDDPREKAVWNCTGTVTLPDTVEDRDGVGLDYKVKLIVKEAEHTAAPAASLESGKYLNDQVTALTTNEEGGTTYYTTDGSDPSEADNAARKEYHGEDIVISRAELDPDSDGVRKMTVKAYTVKEDKWDSQVVTYNYEFDNEIPVPTGEQLEYNTQEQIGLKGGKLYTAESLTDGCEINDEGNAVAVNAGSYKVKLHLTDPNCKWILPQEDDTETDGQTEKQTSTEDQTVSFIIQTVPIRYMEINGIEDKVYTGRPVKQNPTLTMSVDGTRKVLAEGTDYELSYENNIDIGEATVTINGIGNFTASALYGFNIYKGALPKHTVTVDNGEQTREYQYAENDSVTVLANPPASQYLANWNAELLDKNGERIEADVADTLLGKSKNRTKATFSMPVPGDKYNENQEYPEGYSLKLTANCSDRITEVVASPAAPVADQDLATETTLRYTAGGTTWTPEDENRQPVQYPIVWTRTVSDGTSQHTVPASGKAYGNSVYTATITVPQSKAEGIMFAPSDTLSGTTETGKTIRVTRDDSNGSAKIVIQFEKTGEGEHPPAEDLMLRIRVLDANSDEYIEDAGVTCRVSRKEDEDTIVTLTAPDVPDEQFSSWDLKKDETGIVPTEGYELTDKTIQIKIPKEYSADQAAVDAKYVPVVNRITAKLTPPKAGQPSQTAAEADTLKVKITNEYEVKPEYVHITWSPKLSGKAGSETADYETAYTASITIEPKEKDGERYVEVRKTGEETYEKINARYCLADHLTAAVNGEPAVFDAEDDCICYTFPETEEEPDSGVRSVTIIDGDKISKHEYHDGDEVTIGANEPSGKYFRSWKVKLLDRKGAVAADNIADALLEEPGDSKLVFRMPAAGDLIRAGEEQKYPAGYSLEMTADYGDRISDIFATVDAPAAGGSLPTKATLKFTAGERSWIPKDESDEPIQYTIAWSYQDQASGAIIPTSGTAFRDTKYTATINVPKNQAEGIVFDSSKNLNGDGSAGTVTGVKRNNADGSAEITIEFEKTGDDGPEPTPGDTSLQIRALDMNTMQYDEDASVSFSLNLKEDQDTIVTLTAPDMQSEQFRKWDFGKNDSGEPGITLVDGFDDTDKTVQVKIPAALRGESLEIFALYVPAVSRISVQLDEPLSGRAMQTAAKEETLKVRVSNQYEIHPDYVDIKWSPEPGDEGKAADQTAYTATVTLRPATKNGQKYILAKNPGDSDYKRMTAEFIYADKLKATVNGRIAVCDKKQNSVSYTFTKTNKKHKVTVTDGDQSRTYQYQEGDRVTISAAEPSGQYYTNWKVTLYDENGDDIADDIADALLGDSVNDVTPTFTMPAAGDNVRDGEKLKYPGHYALAFTAVYENRITALNASLTAPEANEKLASEAKIRFDKEIPAQSQLISWTYSYKENGKTVIVPASGTAYRDTVYTATITIPKNPKEGILFAPSGSLTGTATAGTVKSVTRNDADGSARIVIEFAKTAPDKGPVRPDEKKAAEQEKYNKQVAAAKKIKAKLTSANAGKYRQAVVKWKKVKSVNGYQIRYSTNKNFKKGVKSVKVNKAGTVKKTLTKLTVGNTYFVQVRIFKKIKNNATGKTAVIYGKWSNTKKFVEMEKAKLTSAKPAKGRKAVVKWKKVKGITGYQIRYSMNKKFKKGVKRVKVNKAGTIKKTLIKLKAQKTYYVQVRAFRKIKKKVVYGKWSNTRKFKAKK